MKKIPALLLAVSLLANVVLVFALVRSGPASRSAKPSAAARAPGAAGPRASNESIVAAMQAGDVGGLLALLQSSGLSERSARFITAGLELQKTVEEVNTLMPETPYWRNRNQNTLSPEVRARISQLSSAMWGRFAELVPQLRPDQYSFLSPGRRSELRRLEKDYDDLNAEMRASSSGFRLQSDIDNIKVLADERKREIDAFLTPAEIAARDMRQSPAARQIRNEYGSVIENEAEYQAAYAVMQAAGNDTAAQNAARAQIEAMLGADRMEKLTQLNDPDYNLIQSAVTRLNLPPAETTAVLTQIRAQAQQASAAVLSNTALTPAQKKAAYKDLAAQSRQQMADVLGAEGADAFAKNSRWMTSLQRGSSFTVDAKGRMRIR